MLPILISVLVASWVMFATSGYKHTIGRNLSAVNHGIHAGAIVYLLTLIFNL